MGLHVLGFELGLFHIIIMSIAIAAEFKVGGGWIDRVLAYTLHACIAKYS